VNDDVRPKREFETLMAFRRSRSVVHCDLRKAYKVSVYAEKGDIG
jgi:hypothetical protein